MAWNQQKNPWGQDQPGSPWGRGDNQNNQEPPDMDSGNSGYRGGPKNPFRDMFSGGNPFNRPRTIAFFAIGALLVWLATGFYRVDANELGVETVFGQYAGTTTPGLNYNWPAPIGGVQTPRVTEVNRVEIGFVSSGDGQRTVNRDRVAESLMLTGDENIIDIQFVVFWQIKDAEDFLFNVRDPEATVKNVAESAMREIIGRNPFDRARTLGRSEIQNQARELIQSMLDGYQTGIIVTNLQMQKVDPPQGVIDAFRDVQAARADKERAINEAQAYFNVITQQADGQGQQIVKEAEAYREEKVLIAQGESQRFLSLLAEYQKSPNTTRQRLYLENIEQILQTMPKILLDPNQAGPLPLLPLQQLLQQQKPAPVATP
jgi:membrane protease subunit HflK